MIVEAQLFHSDQPIIEATPAPRAVISPLADFWLLGGASILVWLAMSLGYFWRESFATVQSRFNELPYAFSFLAMVANHPHFLASYKLSYGRGGKFVLKNWLALILVPLLLLASFFLAFEFFTLPIGDSSAIYKLNDWLHHLGIPFNFGTAEILGAEILGLSIWFMNISVGWHYSKQVYGAALMQAHFANYPISKRQRQILKASVFAVAIYQFFHMAQGMIEAYGGERFQDPRFPGIFLSQMAFPQPSQKIVAVGVALLFLAVVFGILIKNRRNHKILPPINFLVPWLAFYVWWIPVVSMHAYYMFIIPFFHSMQYLPFAYKLEAHQIQKGPWRDFRISLVVVALVLAGFAYFDLVPTVLDQYFQTSTRQVAGFFMIAFSVFINIHHFFIDSVIWKLRQPQIRRAFFG